MLIKITPADQAFSRCIRERAGWRCERCGKQYGEGYQGLHCSHHHRRGHWSIRFEPLNAEALCYGCHSHVGGTEQRIRECLTESQYDLLIELKNNIDRAKQVRKTKGVGDIAKHYRNELARMKELRSKGETGRIEFVGWV